MTELIVALDTFNENQAKIWVKDLDSTVNFYKVGLELFTSAGPQIVSWLKEQGKRVFLDLKFHDIPNTASKAVASARRMGADLCTIHAPGGREMLEACLAEAGNTKLLAVTVLTSLDNTSLQEAGYNRTVAEQVPAMARLAYTAGIHGVICAPSDLAALTELPSGFLRVTPGIRPAGSASHDQKRILTPALAHQAGASHIVVGRPITGAENPGMAALAILQELEAR
jgi:orotidine-5'-phosphate decarboxylase